MRREFFGRLLFVLALVLQAFTPTTAESHSPSYEICSSVDEISIDDIRRTPTPRHRDCDFCLSCHADWRNAPVAATPIADGVASPEQWTALVWLSVERAPSSLRDRRAHRARGPPIHP